jgi:hypothetical protein
MDDKPIIVITNPEVVTDEKHYATYNYDKSHIIFKGTDLGSFEDLVKEKDRWNTLKKFLRYHYDWLFFGREIIEHMKDLEGDSNDETN